MKADKKSISDKSVAQKKQSSNDVNELRACLIGWFRDHSMKATRTRSDDCDFDHCTYITNMLVSFSAREIWPRPEDVFDWLLSMTSDRSASRWELLSRTARLMSNLHTDVTKKTSITTPCDLYRLLLVTERADRRDDAHVFDLHGVLLEYLTRNSTEQNNNRQDMLFRDNERKTTTTTAVRVCSWIERVSAAETSEYWWTNDLLYH